MIIHSIRVAVDPLVWEIPLFIIGLAAALGLWYLLVIHIAYKMAKNRHRDPTGWVLLSVFVSPPITWIILLILGDDNTTHNPPPCNMPPTPK